MRVALLILCLLLTGCPSPAKRKPGAVDPLDQVRNALEEMRSYRASLVSVMDPSALLSEEKAKAATGEARMTVTSELAVALPDRMNQKVSLKNPEGEMQIHMVFTGKKVRAVTSMKKREQAVLFDQKSLARDGHPFDVGYNLQGHGLESGEDLVGTLLAYLERYSFTGPGSKEYEVEGEPCLLLTGRQKKDRALEMLFSRPRTVGGLVLAQKARDEASLPTVPGGGLVGMAARVVKRTALLRLWVSRKDHLPRRWTLGDGEKVLLDVRVGALEPAAKHPPGTFKISADQLKATPDITAATKQQLEKTEEAARDATTVRRVKEELEKLLGD